MFGWFKIKKYKVTKWTNNVQKYEIMKLNASKIGVHIQNQVRVFWAKLWKSEEVVHSLGFVQFEKQKGILYKILT